MNDNDTLSVNSFDFSFGNSNTVKVLAKDSILINSQYRKRIKLDGYSIFYGPEYWIEGIGSSFGIFNSGISGLLLTDVCFPNLLCYKQNSVLTYKNPACLTCFDIICTDLGINESYTDAGLTVCPNPTGNILNIQIKDFSFTKDAALKITNLSGRIILEKEITKQITIEDLKPGIYFLHFYNQEQLIATKKIIRE